jgi:AcrR family transcriptional regulator
MPDAGQARPSWKERKKQDLHDELVDVALSLYERSGFVPPSVDDIVQEVGVAKGTFYLHFPSKADIIKAVLEKGIVELEEAVGTSVNSPHSSASDALASALSATFGFFERRKSMVRLLAQERGFDAPDLSPEMRSELRTRYRRATIVANEKIIRMGMLQGALREIDAHMASVMLYGIVVALLNEAVEANSGFDGLCAAAMDVFNDGVIRRGV